MLWPLQTRATLDASLKAIWSHTIHSPWQGPQTPSLKLDANTAGTGKLHLMKQSGADVIGLDWGVDMALARQELGSSTCVQGNVDPMTLFASEDCIRSAVEECLSKAGPSRHILNVGDGVMQGTPEASVGLFCDLARQSADSRELVGAA